MQLKVQINIKLPENKDKKSETKFHTYMTFCISGLLAISESLPFLEKYKGNGILDALKKLNNEFK